MADASYTNTIGDPLLTAHRVDPDFDPDQRALYYVRVIEVPKPRWIAYDAKFFNIKMPEQRLDDRAGSRVLLSHLVHAMTRRKSI